MSALVLDAGALVAVDRGDRPMMARLRAALQHSISLRTTAIVLAQVWRDSRGRQAELARLLKAVEIREIDEALGREAGILLGRTGTTDPIDATIVLAACHGDRILTSDVHDLQQLAKAARKRVAIIAC